MPIACERVHHTSNNTMQICPNNVCYGCAVCENICPQHAIRMIKDEAGFLYPCIDIARCIECGKCKKVCPANGCIISFSLPVNVFAAKASDEVLRKESQSGGIAAVISEYVINNDGVVYGAALHDDMSVSHIRVDSDLELSRLQGSKYVQSIIREVLLQIKRDITDGKMVLFTGNPCQCAAIRNYIGMKSDKLIVIDILCHGVPSPELWMNYVHYIEKSYKGKIRAADFRDRKDPWGESNERYEFTDNRVIKSKEYLSLFYSNVFARECCATCQYAQQERIGDVSIGDYWGIEDVCPDFIDNFGVSVVLVNTDKGKKLWDKLRDKVQAHETILLDACRKNEPLNRPAGMSKQRKYYIKCHKLFGINGVLRYNKLIQTATRFRSH